MAIIHHFHFDPPTRQALDPQTGGIIKDIFKLIQALHQLQIVDHAINADTFPSGMNRQVTRLTAFIKPSSPTEDFQKSVADNKTWMQTNVILLQTHYSNTIAYHSDIIANEAALTVASGWAQKRYRPRLHPDFFQTLSSLTHHPPTHTDHTHVSESKCGPDAVTVDSDPRQPPDVELDLQDEHQFPRLSRAMPPLTRGLYLGTRPALIEQ